MLDSSLSIYGKSIDKRTTDAYHPRAKCASFDDVMTIANASVHHDMKVIWYSAYNFLHSLCSIDSALATVELSASMV